MATMDMPPWYYFLKHRSAGNKSLKGLTLEFSGFKTKVSSFGRIKGSSDEKRGQWLERANKLGRKDARKTMKGKKVQDESLTAVENLATA